MADRTKRETRARMAQTGERYTTARRHVLSSQEHRPRPDATFDVVAVRDLAADEVDRLSGEELVRRFNSYLSDEGNPWHVNLEELSLELDDGSYEVALDCCRTSAETLDWITQVATKSWATDAILAGLVRALEMVIDPQTHLCARGDEQGPVDWLPEDVEANVRTLGAL